MKLSTELALANLVVLGALWYCAIQGMLGTTIILFTMVCALRAWSLSAAHKERMAEAEEAKAKLREILRRKFKGEP